MYEVYSGVCLWMGKRLEWRILEVMKKRGVYEVYSLVRVCLWMGRKLERRIYSYFRRKYGSPETYSNSVLFSIDSCKKLGSFTCSWNPVFNYINSRNCVCLPFSSYFLYFTFRIISLRQFYFGEIM